VVVCQIIIKVRLVLEIGVKDRKQQYIGVGEVRCQSFSESQILQHLVSAATLRFRPHIAVLKLYKEEILHDTNMGSSTKKKKEKKKDFQKPKLKVGKARPKNTNATDTSFTAKSIVFKQQNLTESGRDATALFSHNLSLLSSKNETQRRDALAYITTVCGARQAVPQSASTIIAKAQPLILDGNNQVRQQLLKLLKSLPADQLGSIDQLLLYTRAGMAHLSNDIRMSALDILDWLVDSIPEAVFSCAGGWVKTLRIFQNLLSWHDVSSKNAIGTNGKWSTSKPATSLGSNKLVVHQLTSLAKLLTVGLTSPDLEAEGAAVAKRAAEIFPLWHTDAHMLPKKSNPFGYLNLFGAPRDPESEIYEDPVDRGEVFNDLLYDAFNKGVKEAKKEGGDVGRAATSVDKALRLAEIE
jgi:pre-rRNA-processing protein IPI1